METVRLNSVVADDLSIKSFTSNGIPDNNGFYNDLIKLISVGLKDKHLIVKSPNFSVPNAIFGS
jgi:hypothetical protein